jgi:hypothetical protein
MLPARQFIGLKTTCQKEKSLLNKNCRHPLPYRTPEAASACKHCKRLHRGVAYYRMHSFHLVGRVSTQRGQHAHNVRMLREFPQTAGGQGSAGRTTRASASPAADAHAF